MATEFSEGTVYTNAATQYGLRPYDYANNSTAASMPVTSWLCCAVTPTHAVFKQVQPTGAGATANPGMLLGVTKRLRVQRDVTGKYVEPLGRRYGMVILRPTLPDTFWSANTCVIDGNSIPVTSLSAFAMNGFKSRTGSAANWNLSSGNPYLTVTPAYSGAILEGVVSLYACIYNQTGADVTPKLICQGTPPNSATVNTGTINLEWNGRVVRTSVAGVLDLTTVGAFPAPVPLPNGMASVSTITIRANGFNLISGTLAFGMSL